VGPTAIFDKSALQALNLDEAVWFDAFLRANLVPIFYVETLADLEKAVAEGHTPEAVVGRLAEKTPSDTLPNLYHRKIVLGELLGQDVRMVGQPVIDTAQAMRGPDGRLGLHVEPGPEEQALLRWQRHEFLEIERATARAWRAELAAHDPDRRIDMMKKILPTKDRISDLDHLKTFIDGFCSGTEPEVIDLALDVLPVPGEYKGFARARWQAEGSPALDRFAPYSAHVFKVDLLFYLGIHRGFISGERASNMADMAYLYYLPFGNVFISGDRLHRRTAPLFLRDGQAYLEATEFKQALGEFDEHYEQLPDEIKQLGVLSFAPYPPSAMDNAVTRLWDAHMRPDWRDMAKRHEADLGRPRDEDAERKTVAELTGRVEAARPIVEEGAATTAEEADYFLISRWVPATKGRWRMVSKEVAEAEETS
jgi:hypothetical protein